jgi:DNA-directed RNA polymerase
VVPYGGTQQSCRDYIRIAAKETGKADLFGTEADLFEACNYLASKMWEAIGETVVAARDAMGWLQKVSQVVSKEDKPINWTAPSGFKVLQAYPNVRERTVKTSIAGMVVKLNLSEDLPTIDKRRQSQGISPNFVHSLDAASLTFTVDAAVACGLESFAMIHDSYGTLAADTDTLRDCLRQAFAQMYQFDVLQSFAAEIQAGLPAGVKLPDLPKKGTLDINQVLQSDFFFA